MPNIFLDNKNITEITTKFLNSVDIFLKKEQFILIEIPISVIVLRVHRVLYATFVIAVDLTQQLSLVPYSHT